MRVIAGAYLAYLGYKILKGGVLGGEMTGGSKILGDVNGRYHSFCGNGF